MSAEELRSTAGCGWQQEAELAATFWLNTITSKDNFLRLLIAVSHFSGTFPSPFSNQGEQSNSATVKRASDYICLSPMQPQRAESVTTTHISNTYAKSLSKFLL